MGPKLHISSQIASTDVVQWLSCFVVQSTVVQIVSRTKDNSFYSKYSSSFVNFTPTLPTMQN